MPIQQLQFTKLLLGNYMQFRSIYHIKEVSSKILYFGHSGAIMRSKLGCVTIYGHTFIAYNSVIFGPIPKKIIQGYSGDDYLPDRLLFGRAGCPIKFGSRRRLFTGAAAARGAKVVETPKFHQKFPLWVGLFGKPLSPN